MDTPGLFYEICAPCFWQCMRATAGIKESGRWPAHATIPRHGSSLLARRNNSALQMPSLHLLFLFSCFAESTVARSTNTRAAPRDTKKVARTAVEKKNACSSFPYNKTTPRTLRRRRSHTRHDDRNRYARTIITKKIAKIRTRDTVRQLPLGDYTHVAKSLAERCPIILARRQPEAAGLAGSTAWKRSKP